MAEAKKPYDMESPEAKRLIDEIVHGTFVKQGTMVAFPTCFPGTTAPIPADESRITALDVTPAGAVYGGTSGRASHLFAGMFRGVTGIVLDMGAVDGATECVAVACGGSRVVGFVNGDSGGRVVARALEPKPFDLIQEWHFERRPFDDLGQVAPGENIVHATALPGREVAAGVTEGHLFTVEIESGGIDVVGEVPGRGRVAVGSAGGVFGLDGPDALWRFDPASGRLDRRAVGLPAGEWDSAPLTWGRDPRSGLLYVADAGGRLYSFDEREGFGPELGRTRLAPAGPMAVTLDGRLFGTCGREMARLFSYDPASGEVEDVGAAVSVIERRRYGYAFGDAVTGSEGEIILGEDDDLGHLWLYFPRIR